MGYGDDHVLLGDEIPDVEFVLAGNNWVRRSSLNIFLTSRSSSLISR